MARVILVHGAFNELWGPHELKERWLPALRAVGDKAAAVALAEKFGDRVEDVLVHNGHRAHAPEPYLNSAVTGAAIAAALT